MLIDDLITCIAAQRGCVQAMLGGILCHFAAKAVAQTVPPQAGAVDRADVPHGR